MVPFSLCECIRRVFDGIKVQILVWKLVRLRKDCVWTASIIQCACPAWQGAWAGLRSLPALIDHRRKIHSEISREGRLDSVNGVALGLHGVGDLAV